MTDASRFVSSYDPTRWPYLDVFCTWFDNVVAYGAVLNGASSSRDHLHNPAEIVSDAVAGLRKRIEFCQQNYRETDYVQNRRENGSRWTARAGWWFDTEEQVVEDVVIAAIAFPDDIGPWLAAYAPLHIRSDNLDRYSNVLLVTAVKNIFDEECPRGYFVGHVQPHDTIAAKIKQYGTQTELERLLRGFNVAGTTLPRTQCYQWIRTRLRETASMNRIQRNIVKAESEEARQKANGKDPGVDVKIVDDKEAESKSISEVANASEEFVTEVESAFVVLRS